MQWKVRPGFFRGSLGDMAKKPRTLHQRLTGKLFKARDCRCSLFIFTSVTGVTQIPIDIARKKNSFGGSALKFVKFFFNEPIHLFLWGYIMKRMCRFRKFVRRSSRHHPVLRSWSPVLRSWYPSVEVMISQCFMLVDSSVRFFLEEALTAPGLFGQTANRVLHQNKPTVERWWLGKMWAIQFLLFFLFFRIWLETWATTIFRSISLRVKPCFLNYSGVGRPWYE